MQPEATFTTQIVIGSKLIDATVVCMEQDGQPIVLWVEVQGQPVPTWVWDLIEADIRANGPCAYAYRQAAGVAHDRPLQAYVAASAAQEERDRAEVREMAIWNGETIQ